MKKETSYGNQEISYWPYYSYGKIGIVFVVVLTILVVLCCIWEWIDQSPRLIPWGLIAIIFFTIALCLLLLRYIRRVMNHRISVSVSGVTIFNTATETCEEIPWNRVSSVCFRRDNWYGLRSIELHLNNPTSDKRLFLSAKTVFVPINQVVDQKKLLGYIPQNLVCNDPEIIC